MRTFRKITDFLLFSNLFVAIPLTCLSRIGFVLFGSEGPQFSFLTFIYFSSFFLYGFHRLWGLEKIPGNECSDRHIWAKRNKRLFVGMLIVAAIGLALQTISLGWALVLPLIPAAIIAWGYTIPLIPWKKRLLRFRDLSMSKIFLIALVVTYITAIIPVLSGVQDQPEPVSKLVWFGMERLFFILAITIPFDIRDLRFDQRSGLRTIPIWLGAKNASWLSVGFLVLAMFLTIAQFMLGHFSGPMAWAFVLSYMVAFPLVLFSRPGKSEYYFSFGIEGTMVVQWIFVEAVGMIFW